MASNGSPTFQNHPVVEVILGAQFSRLDLSLRDGGEIKSAFSKTR
jgi:hypothetical protein